MRMKGSFLLLLEFCVVVLALGAKESNSTRNLLTASAPLPSGNFSNSIGGLTNSRSNKKSSKSSKDKNSLKVIPQEPEVKSKSSKSKSSSSKSKNKRSKDNSTLECLPSEFICDGKCLESYKVCDGHNDCSGGDDEEHCDFLLAECGGPDDFLCKNGKCISKKWVCDNVNDCFLHGDGDLSDEIHCDHTNSSSVKKQNPMADECNPENSFRCKDSSAQCLPLSFRCDLEVDCLDGSDEHDCMPMEEKCEGKFQCVSGECLSLKRKCDDKVDCLDGWSDEEDCVKPHECLLSDGLFLCKSGGGCISADKVCNAKPDCLDKSDEFPNCEKSCVNSTCSQGCIPDSPSGYGCYCFKGYALSPRDKGKCVDIDECQLFGTCSQSCDNLLGSFKCSCKSGFTLDDRDGSSCKLKEDNASLIFALNSGIRVLHLGRKEKYYSLVDGVGSPVMISYDARAEWVYWTDALEHEEGIWRARINGNDRQLVVSTGLILPEGIAFDWIASNIYFTDSNRSHIVVCTGDGVNCTVLIQEQMDKPRDIALDPNAGLLFWTDWGTSPSIMKSGMDGSMPVGIIMDNVKWPNGITVDQGNLRIYWTDARTDRIESANYFGDDRRIVKSKGINHPFGVDVLGDNLYWSDWNLYEIQTSNKFNGSRSHSVLVKENFEQLNGLVLYHKANQPMTRRNHCADAGCSHICTLTPNKSYKCMCPRGTNLNQRDKKTCIPHIGWQQFIVGYNNTLKTLPMESIGGNVFKSYLIPEISVIGAIAPVHFNNTLFISDLERKKIHQFDLSNGKLTPVIEDNLIYVKGLAYDEIGGNLYWVDSSKKTVEAMNLKTRARIILFKEIDRPIDIVLAPDLRLMFLAELGAKGGKIVRMNMNGYNRRVLRRTSGNPFALTYNKEMQRVYWTDGLSEMIESVEVDGGGDYVAVSRAGAPYGITALNNKIYWTDTRTSEVRGKCLDTLQEERGVHFGEIGEKGFFSNEFLLAKIAVLNREEEVSERLKERHQCAQKNNVCSHICLLSNEQFQGTCVCPENLRLDTDGKTCVELLVGEVPTGVLCTKGRCRKPPSPKPTTKRPKSKKTKGDKDKTDVEGRAKDDKDNFNFDVFEGEEEPTTEYYIDEGYKWTEDKKKGKKSSKYDRDSRREQVTLDYDEYEDGISPQAKLLPNGRWVVPGGEGVTQQESSMDKNVVEDGSHPMAIVLGVLIILILVGVIIGIVLHRRNVHPKVLVRPYVQHWVRYVNQPVQRFFEGRGGGEQLDGKKNIYDQVYHSPSSEHTYSNVGYEDIDPVTDGSVNLYSEADDHRINYKQTQKLLD